MRRRSTEGIREEDRARPMPGLRVSRRDALLAGAGALAASALSAAYGGAPYAQPGLATGSARIVMVQAPWAAGAARAAMASLRATLAMPGRTTLLLLGLAEGACAEREAIADLGALARELGAHVAAAMRIIDSSRRTALLAFLVAPDGRALLRVRKITPEALAGFDTTDARLDVPATAAVADTPLGRIGLLPGEDLFAPTRVRALVFAGAEIVLNPARELANEALGARRDAPLAIAYHHGVLVASATPLRTLAGERLAGRSALTDWTGAVAAAGDTDLAFANLDVERLRRFRLLAPVTVNNVSQHLLPMVRDELYARVLEHHATRMPPLLADVPRDPAQWRDEHARLAAAQLARTTPRERLEPVWEAAIVQSPERSVRDAADRKAAAARNVEALLAMAAPYARRDGVRLVVFPEFAFTAAGWRTITDIRSVALAWGGRELEPIQRFAQQHRVHVAFQQLEDDPRFPGRVFNTAFIVGDTGNLLARHRKLQCVDIYGTLPDTTPGSIYDAYVREYGVESLVQVVDTPLGKLAPLVCYEMMFPEIRQLYAQRGAEVVLHLTAEGYDSITETRYAWNAARRQAAMESSAYVLCANKGDENASPWKPIGESQFIDPSGRVLGMLRESKPGVLLAKVELPVVWAARRDPTANFAIWDRPGASVDAYRRGIGVANNLWAGSPDEFPYADLAVYRRIHAGLYDRGIYVRPRSG